MKHTITHHSSPLFLALPLFLAVLPLGIMSSCSQSTPQEIIDSQPILDITDTPSTAPLATSQEVIRAHSAPTATVLGGSAAEHKAPVPAVSPAGNTPYETALGENKILQHYIQLIDANYPRLSSMEDAFAFVESGYDPTAYNPDEQSCGLLAIRQCMLDHFHEIIGCKIFTLDDMFEESYALLVFEVVQLHDNPRLDIKQGCRVWNRRHPASYYHKINKKFQSNLRMPVNELTTASM